MKKILILLPLLLILSSCGPLTPVGWSKQSSIVEIARSQLGKGEEGGNNHGVSVRKYTRGSEVAWCAGFVSWVLQESGHQQKYLLSAREYWAHYKTHRTKNPRPGDIICFYRGSRGNRLGHVGIIEEVKGFKIITIEGNVGKYPAKVKRVEYQIGKIPKLLGFIRIS